MLAKLDLSLSKDVDAVVEISTLSAEEVVVVIFVVVEVVNLALAFDLIRYGDRVLKFGFFLDGV